MFKYEMFAKEMITLLHCYMSPYLKGFTIPGEASLFKELDSGQYLEGFDVITLIKKKIEFSSYITKFRKESVAKSYMTTGLLILVYG
jgi:hypothetical protein